MTPAIPDEAVQATAMQTLEEQTWHELECAANSTGGIEVAMVSLPIEKVKALVAGRPLPSSLGASE